MTKSMLMEKLGSILLCGPPGQECTEICPGFAMDRRYFEDWMCCRSAKKSIKITTKIHPQSALNLWKAQKSGQLRIFSGPIANSLRFSQAVPAMAKSSAFSPSPKARRRNLWMLSDHPSTLICSSELPREIQESQSRLKSDSRRQLY
jgi:hypothetical protein